MLWAVACICILWHIFTFVDIVCIAIRSIAVLNSSNGYLAGKEKNNKKSWVLTAHHDWRSGPHVCHSRATIVIHTIVVTVPRIVLFINLFQMFASDTAMLKDTAVKQIVHLTNRGKLHKNSTNNNQTAQNNNCQRQMSKVNGLQAQTDFLENRHCKLLHIIVLNWVTHNISNT